MPRYQLQRVIIDSDIKWTKNNIRVKKWQRKQSIRRFSEQEKAQNANRSVVEKNDMMNESRNDDE